MLQVQRMQVPYKSWDDDTDDQTAGDWDAGSVEAVAPTPEELAAINRDAARTLVRSIVVQLSACVLVCLVAWLVAGPAAGASALVGAAACAIPNALFAVRLLFGMFRPGGLSSVTFFLGEFIKLGSTGILLGLAVKFGQDVLVWPALFVGLLVALKSHYGLLLFRNS